MIKRSDKIKGVTLLEVLLVLVIATSVLAMFLTYTTQKSDELRRNSTVLQMQQILNAGLSFYNQRGRWPGLQADPSNGNWTNVDSTSELINGNYLPGGTRSNQGWANPYNVVYQTGIDTTTNTFYVSSGIHSSSPGAIVNAGIIASQLPFGRALKGPVTGTPPPTQTACTAGADCMIVANVPPPGQNLNNARSINFAGIYHSGACVPAPTCPSGMTPAIYVAPTGVSGVNDAPTGCPAKSNDPNSPDLTGCQANVYPVSSFSAYAQGASVGSSLPAPANPGPLDCKTTGTLAAVACDFGYSDAGGQLNQGTAYQDPQNTTYWRVCLRVITEKGQVYPANGAYQHGEMMGSIMAVTRCVPTNEAPRGSGFAVFGPNQPWTP